MEFNEVAGELAPLLRELDRVRQEGGDEAVQELLDGLLDVLYDLEGGGAEEEPIPEEGTSG